MCISLRGWFSTCTRCTQFSLSSLIARVLTRTALQARFCSPHFSLSHQEAPKEAYRQISKVFEHADQALDLLPRTPFPSLAALPLPAPSNTKERPKVFSRIRSIRNFRNQASNSTRPATTHYQQLESLAKDRCEVFVGGAHAQVGYMTSRMAGRYSL